MAPKQYKVDLDVCPMPLMLVDQTGRIVRTNHRLDSLFGFDVSELAGQTIEILFPPSTSGHHPDLRDVYFQMPTSRETSTGRDLHGVSKSGVTIPVEIGLEPMEFGGQKMVMVSVIDIRERKRSEATMRRALDSAASAMIQVNERGLIELANKPSENLFGYTVEELLGQSIEILVPERFRTAHSTFRVDYNSHPKKRAMGVGKELYGLRKDGSEFPLEIGLTPVQGADKRSIMATIIDTTERRAKARLIQQKNEQLRRANTDLMEFAYSASHDLKAPLASITGLLGFCEQDIDQENYDEVTSNIKKCRTLTRRLADRVEDVLSLARSDLESVDLEVVNVRDCIQAIWASLPFDGVELQLDFHADSTLNTVKPRFEIILENLLSNAIKYADPDKSVKFVRVRCWEDHRQFQLLVEDNGIGIPKGQEEKIFQLFHRLSTNSVEGTGMGLPLAKKHAIRLGGDVRAELTNQLTCFNLTLPTNVEVNRGEST